MESIKEVVERSLVSSGQFTPEQRTAIAEAIAIAFENQISALEQVAKELGTSDKELKSRLP